MTKVKRILIFGLFMAGCTFGFAQNITTASAYFKTVSDFYAGLKSYEAEFEITMSVTETSGHLSFKAPDLLRLDFTNPEEQVIVFSSNLLTIYLPGSAAVLQQQVSSDSNVGTMATAKGLELMNRYYTVAYEIGQEPVPFEDDPEEKVMKLILYKRSTAEAFKNIKLSISATTNLIKKIEATTNNGEVFVMNFFDYKLNPEISDQRFLYDAPSSANTYNNFLFSE
ncbi:MAG: outer membrane lipoprotein carrier protein LolA [Treponema sp.]|nr:outer membrane lipoprotein carrier protein LolA [Treponema sp.]